MKVLQVEGLTAAREGRILLEQIRLEIPSGQVTGLIGDNPDRLNFLLSILGGIEPEQSGRLRYDGQAWGRRRRLRGVGIARDPGSLVDSLPVLDNLFRSNSSLHSWFGIIQRDRRQAHARAVLRRLAFPAALDQRLQRVEPHARVMLDLARVLIQDPAYYLFNGVTRVMGERQYEAFLGLVKELRSAGKGILVVPVNAGDVRSLIDRLYFLQGTQLVEIDRPRDLTDEQLHDLFLGRLKTHDQTVGDPILRAKHFLDGQAATPEVDFQALADSVAMSYDNFRRRFKNQTGTSPNQYLLHVKIERAKELLLFTDTEVKDIAPQVGFADPSYFSRVFKEKAGVSPHRYRTGLAKTVVAVGSPSSGTTGRREHSVGPGEARYDSDRPSRPGAG